MPFTGTATPGEVSPRKLMTACIPPPADLSPNKPRQHSLGLGRRAPLITRILYDEEVCIHLSLPHQQALQLRSPTRSWTQRGIDSLSCNTNLCHTNSHNILHELDPNAFDEIDNNQGCSNSYTSRSDHLQHRYIFLNHLIPYFAPRERRNLIVIPTNDKSYLPMTYCSHP